MRFAMKKSLSILLLSALLLGLGSAPVLSGCAARTKQEKKTSRYKRKHRPGKAIPCPTKDC